MRRMRGMHSGTTTTTTCLVTNDQATGIYLSDVATRLIGGKYGRDVSPREADIQTVNVSTSRGVISGIDAQSKGRL